MKKIFAFILMLTMMMLTSTNYFTQAAEDALDIEKAAIKTMEKSQLLKSNDLRIQLMQTNYANTKGQLSQMKNLIPYTGFFPGAPGAFEIVKSYMLLPQQLEDTLTQLNNMQGVFNNTVRLGAYSQYIELLKADYALNIQKDLMNSLYEDYKKAQLQKDLGMVTEDQLRLAKIAYEQTRYNYLSAQNDKDSAYMALNNMMGEAIDKKYAVLKDYNVIPAAKIRTPEEYIKQALANRAEVINAESKLSLLEEEYRYGAAEFPADFEFYKQQQEHKIEDAKNELELARINVQQNILELYTALEMSMKTMEAMKSLAQQAEENYKAAQIRFDQGMITAVELNNEKIKKAQADINLKNAELDAWLMQTTMNMACDAGIQLR